MARRTLLKLETLNDRIAPATFTVLNNNDAGTGSLRQAILDANAMAGTDVIVFNATFKTAQTITLTSGTGAASCAIDRVGTTGAGRRRR